MVHFTYPYIQSTDLGLNLMARPRIAAKRGRGNLGANVRTFCFGVNPAPSVWGSHTPKMGAKRFTTIFLRQKLEFRSVAVHETFRRAPRLTENSGTFSSDLLSLSNNSQVQIELCLF